MDSTTYPSIFALDALTGALFLLTAIGVVLVVFAIIRWLWDRRRSGFQGNHSGLLWTFGVGAVLAAPDVVIPLLLGLADLVTNAVIGLFGNL